MTLSTNFLRDQLLESSVISSFFFLKLTFRWQPNKCISVAHAATALKGMHWF